MQMWELVARESVRQTMAEYTAATDRFDLHGIAACFGSEGTLEFTGGAEPLRGPAAIEAGLGAALGAPREPGLRTASFVRHHVASPRFGSVTPDRVEASSYFAVYTDVGVDHWGRYRDVLVPVGQQWLFLSRRIAVDSFSAASLMAQ
jgi:SnoaL-like domain